MGNVEYNLNDCQGYCSDFPNTWGVSVSQISLKFLCLKIYIRRLYIWTSCHEYITNPCLSVSLSVCRLTEVKENLPKLVAEILDSATNGSYIDHWVYVNWVYTLGLVRA